MRKLSPAALDWSLEHLRRHSDTDKFPVPFEINVIERTWKSGLRDQLANLDLTQHRWKGDRKMLVPKDSFSFRNAAQLDPVDALLFAAIIFETGHLIERNDRLSQTSACSAIASRRRLKAISMERIAGTSSGILR